MKKGILLATQTLFLTLSSFASPIGLSQKMIFVDLDEVFGHFYQQAQDDLRDGNSNNSPFIKLIEYQQACELEDSIVTEISDTICDCCLSDTDCSTDTYKRHTQLEHSLSEEIKQRTQKIADEMGAYAIINSSFDISDDVKFFLWVNPDYNITQLVIESLSNDWLCQKSTSCRHFLEQSNTPQRIVFVNIQAILNSSTAVFYDPFNFCCKRPALCKQYPAMLEFSHRQKIYDDVCNSFLQKIETLENKASNCENNIQQQKFYDEIEHTHQIFLKVDHYYKDAFVDLEKKIKKFAISLAKKLHADILLTNPSLLEYGPEEGLIWAAQDVDITTLVINELNSEWLTSHKQQ